MTPDPPPAEDLPTAPAPEEWALVFRPRRSDVPVVQRVKRLLKWADTLGLTCVCVRLASDEELGLAAEWVAFELREVVRGNGSQEQGRAVVGEEAGGG